MVVTDVLPALNTIHFGDAFTVIQDWPDAFVDCTVTSVPYYQQRSYLPADHKLKAFEMGSEESVELYLAGMRELFGEVLRITKPTGTLFLNVGDKYHDGQLLGIPWKLAEALRGIGWRLSSEVIWNKPNALMDAAVKRVSLSHEQVFLFTKTRDNFFDAHAIAEPSKDPGRPARNRGKFHLHRVRDRIVSGTIVGAMTRPRSVWEIPTVALNGRKLVCDLRDDGRYLARDADCPVHGDDPTVSPGPLFGDGDPECTCSEVTEDFFAAMPPRLAERCILAGSSEAGVCSECGQPMKRLTKKIRQATRPAIQAKLDMSGRSHRDPERHVTSTETIGWEPTCQCGAQARSAILFDPFVGSGTTPMVAEACGRSWVATELNPHCARELAPARIRAGWQRSPLAP